MLLVTYFNINTLNTLVGGEICYCLLKIDFVSSKYA